MSSRFNRCLLRNAFAWSVCLAWLVLGTALAQPAAAQTVFTVTTLTDTTSGTASNCTIQLPSSRLDGACSLRDALAAAAQVNGTSGTVPVTVNFAPSLAAIGSPGMVTLGATALALPSYTAVQGLTAGSGYSLTNLITIAGNGHAIFTTSFSGVGSALRNLVLANGAPAVTNLGGLAVSQCTFANNTYSRGGAIYNYGPLTVTASTFTGNSSSEYGGAIYSTGSDGGYPGKIVTTRNLTITSSTFQGNSSTDGGAVYIGLDSVGAIDSSTFTGNSAERGAAIFLNNGSYLSRVTNSILTGDSGGSECDGFGCGNAARGFLFTGGASKNGTITMTATLSTGEVIKVDAAYGPASSGASMASTFGAYISSRYYGTLSAQGFGATLLVEPPYATLTSITFNDPGGAFTITPLSNSVLSGTGNTVAVGTAAANLSALGSFGGPTQTVLPLPGSAALCAITPASATGTDQRGLPRTTAFGPQLCQDSGAVQTSYSLAFAQQPGNTTVGALLAPPPTVQVSESGQPLLQANAPVTVKDRSGLLNGNTTASTVATGLASFSNLSVGKVQLQDTLTASLPVGANSVSATSSAFDVLPPSTATLSGAATFPPTVVGTSASSVFTFTNTGASALRITALSVQSAPEWTQTNTCGLTLAAGGSCTITITFQPLVDGARSGTLMLASDAAGYMQTVALQGTGTLAPSFTLADDASGGPLTALALLAGSTGTGVVRLTSLNGYAGSVALVCVAQGTAAAGITCTVDSPVSLTAGGTARATVTVTTTARVVHAGFAGLPRSRPVGRLVLLAVCLAALGSLRARRVVRLASYLLVAALLSGALSGCGGPVFTPLSAGGGTAAGTYRYTVTGTSGTLMATQTVTVTVR